MLKPLKDYLIVEPLPMESIGGFEMPQITQSKPLKGTVIAIGDGLNGKPMSTKVGDTVLYKTYSGWEIDFEGKPFLLMSEINDILAIY